jgi:tRNA A37 threonylcarbamoyltransferase TsaD
MQGSANKVGVGIIKYTSAVLTLDGQPEYEILANPRKTFVPPAGQGFLPRETAWHHQNHIVALVRMALIEANLNQNQIDVICYTKGPGMGGPLRSCAVAARMISLLFRVPIVAVNHCLGHIGTVYYLSFIEMTFFMLLNVMCRNGASYDKGFQSRCSICVRGKHSSYSLLRWAVPYIR